MNRKAFSLATALAFTMGAGAAGNYLNNKLNLGGQVYQRFMATPPSGGARHR